SCWWSWTTRSSTSRCRRSAATCPAHSGPRRPGPAEFAAREHGPGRRHARHYLAAILRAGPGSHFGPRGPSQSRLLPVITNTGSFQISRDDPGRTFALTELLVRATWRRQGTAGHCTTSSWLTGPRNERRSPWPAPTHGTWPAQDMPGRCCGRPRARAADAEP